MKMSLSQLLQILLLVDLLKKSCVHSFIVSFTEKFHGLDSTKHPSTTHHHTSRLYGGIGTANTYEWEEDQYEIEIKIPLPAHTKSKDIEFKAHPRSISLTVRNYDDDGEKKIFDEKRECRGMIDIDGTFWSIADRERPQEPYITSSSEDSQYDFDTYGREITVTIEKQIIPPQDQFSLVEFDWGGIYPDDEDEVSYRKYDEAEELNIREYAASLGVDIDNINMTMVDKNMFSSGINMTRSTMDELTKQGYVQEVTQQNNGLEFLQDEDGKAVPIDDSLMSNVLERESDQTGTVPLSSMFEQTMPAKNLEQFTSPQHMNMPAEEQQHQQSEVKQTPNQSPSGFVDPIDKLTVARLKDILRNENLKVSGNKKELQDRLKDHVKNIVKER